MQHPFVCFVVALLTDFIVRHICISHLQKLAEVQQFWMTENQATSSNSQQVNSEAPIKRLEVHISFVTWLGPDRPTSN